MAVTVSDRDPKEPGRGDRPRMVVFGDASIASNVSSRGYDLLTSSFEWLAERPQNMGIEPKESSSFTLQPGTNVSRMVWLPLGLMALGFLGLGTGVWVVRRR